MFSPIYRLSLCCLSSRHPNILGLYGYFWDDTSIYIVMEYGFYGDLKKLLDQHGKFSERRAAWFIARIANAIAYMQDRGVIHRDIKAENVLLYENFNARLIDFGLCNTSQNGMLLTSCGSLCYASPEIVAGKPYSTPTDVWSLGVLLFAMAVGSLPFDDVNQKRLAQKILYGQPAMPATLSETIV